MVLPKGLTTRLRSLNAMLTVTAISDVFVIVSCICSIIQHKKEQLSTAPSHIPFLGLPQLLTLSQNLFPIFNLNNYLRAAIAFLTFSVSSGRIFKASPTTPKSATSKIGAVESLFIAMITSDSSMPARCCMAPDMPQAI